MIKLTETHKLTKDKVIAVAPSRVIAEAFDKRHDNVIRDIENLLKTEVSNALKSEVVKLFIESTYQDGKGEIRKQYLLTRDGYTLLAFGFTGAKALNFKLKYIKAFNLMEEEIKRQKIARRETKESFKAVTDALKALKGKSVKATHFTNESRMITKIVLGMDSKRYKELNNIRGELRDHLNALQLEALETLEQYDSMLISAGIADYKVRKAKCEEYYQLISKAIS